MGAVNLPGAQLMNGNGIAFVIFTLLCGALEFFGPGAGNLWMLVVLWAIFGEFNKDGK